MSGRRYIHLQYEHHWARLSLDISSSEVVFLPIIRLPATYVGADPAEAVLPAATS